MKSLPKRFLAVVLTLALGLGVWTIAAVSFQQSDFSAGDVLSADELNNLLNDNFDAAADAINENADDITALDGQVSSNETDISNLDGRVSDNEADIGDLQNNKVDRDGDSMSGALTIAAGDATALDVTSNGSDEPTVSIKNEGGGPVLEVFATGGFGLMVDPDGKVQIGNAITEVVTITLDPEEGTITNDVGSGLPVAFASADSSGNIISGTENVSLVDQTATGRYQYSIDGFSVENGTIVTVSSRRVTTAEGPTAQWNAQGGDLFIGLRDSDGNLTDNAFSFVVYAAP